jgi:hypothetical protein
MQESPMSFDPTRRLVMAKFKTVLGHGVTVGTPLRIVDEPSEPGEVDKVLAERLWASGLATYAEDRRPTRVETEEEQKIREANEALNLRDFGVVPDGEPPVDAVPPDLLTWQTDDEELGRKAGDRVTMGDLRVIAGREEIAVAPGSNKPELIAQIIAARAARVPTE